MTAAGPLAGRPRWPAVLAWALWALATLGIALIPWLDHLLRQAGRADLVNFTPGATNSVSSRTAGMAAVPRAHQCQRGEGRDPVGVSSSTKLVQDGGDGEAQRR